MKRWKFAALIAAPLAAFTMPAVAAAQDETGDEKVNMVIIYGDDECPAPAAGEITVCARKAENERYRIPENLRFSEGPQNTSWAERAESLEMVGAFGTLSCDPAGAGGFLGCTQQMIDAAYKDRKDGSDVRFSQLIAAARAERLSTIDADAAAQQDRVEQIEREYMERLERERAGQTPDESAAEQGPPALATPPADAEAGANEPE